MAIKTTVRQIDNALGIVLPEEALHVLNVKEGATLRFTELPGKALRMTAENPISEDMMAIVERVMQRYSNALRELAR